jgi:hypothetical protein
MRVREAGSEAPISRGMWRRGPFAGPCVFQAYADGVVHLPPSHTEEYFPRPLRVPLIGPCVSEGLRAHPDLKGIEKRNAFYLSERIRSKCPA